MANKPEQKYCDRRKTYFRYNMLLNKLNLNDIIEKNKSSNNLNSINFSKDKRDSEVSKTRHRYQSLNEIIVSARNETKAGRNHNRN
jgi:hypothetical protein